MFVSSLVLSLFFFVFLSGCKNQVKYQVINYKLGRNISTLDPQSAGSDESTVIKNIFDGLVRIGPNGEVLPAIAAFWESDSDSTFTFHLSKEAKWSDQKTNVTAYDFVFGIKRAIDPKTKSPFVKEILCIKNSKSANLGEKRLDDVAITAVDDYTLKIELEYPFKDFPKICSLSSMMPCCQNFFETCNGQYGKNIKTLLTNGPFGITKNWERGRAINLVKNKNYFRKDERGFSPSIKLSINDEFSDNKNTKFDLFASEEIDACFFNPSLSTKFEKLGAKIFNFNNKNWGLIFNCQGTFFSNENLRKSFISSIDRKYLSSEIEKIRFLSLSDHIVAENITINSKKYIDLASNIFQKSKLDPKELLKLAMKELKNNSIKEIVFLSPNDEGLNTIANTLLELFNKNLDTNLNIRSVQEENLNLEINAGNFELALMPISFKTSNDPMETFDIFKSNSPDNIAMLKNSEFDSLLEATKKTSDDKIVTAIEYLEKFLVNHAVFYPVCSSSECFAVNKKIQDLIFNPENLDVDFTFAKKRR
jgi:oligopeptide transport system substrate-binding protein